MYWPFGATAAGPAARYSLLAAHFDRRSSAVDWMVVRNSFSARLRLAHGCLARSSLVRCLTLAAAAQADCSVARNLAEALPAGKLA